MTKRICLFDGTTAKHLDYVNDFLKSIGDHNPQIHPVIMGESYIIFIIYDVEEKSNVKD